MHNEKRSNRIDVITIGDGRHSLLIEIRKEYQGNGI